MKSKIALFRTVWNAVLGISFELLLVYFFILAGFLTCFIWWAIFR